MEAKDLIDAIRQALNQAEGSGHTQLQIPAFKQYLAALEKAAGESKELRQLDHASSLAHFNATSSHNIEMLKAVLEAGQSALQAVIVINGGAVIALLGVMSNLAVKDGGALLARYLALPLLQFGAAVLCGALGFAFRYFSQAMYGEAAFDSTRESKFSRWGDCFRYTAIAAALGGYVLFGFGIFNSYRAVIWTFSS